MKMEMTEELMNDALDDILTESGWLINIASFS